MKIEKGICLISKVLFKKDNEDHEEEDVRKLLKKFKNKNRNKLKVIRIIKN